MPLTELQNGRYQGVRFIGSGSMGEVYLMNDTRINRQVAIKVIRTEVSPYVDSQTAADAGRLFQREAHAIAALEHSNILPLYDFGEEKTGNATLSYMVTPFCPEGSLAEWIHKRNNAPSLTPQDIAFLIGQAADALQYAHDHQVIHLDVKPPNFLIRSNGKNVNRPTLLLADFGVARLNANTTSASQTVRGTPTSMAPEQWSGSPVPATDQYALAIMAYELLVGRPPFLGGMEQLMYQHFNVPPAPPSSYNRQLPAAVDTVILRALAKNPAERFPSISEFATAFEQALQNAPASPMLGVVRPNSRDMQATLAISKGEAMAGTNRTLTLADGQHVTVAIPAGAYHGQIIRLAHPNGSQSGGASAEALVLKIMIQQEENVNSVSDTGGDATTMRAQPSISGADQMHPLAGPAEAAKVGSQGSNPQLGPVSGPGTPGMVPQPGYQAGIASQAGYQPGVAPGYQSGVPVQPGYQSGTPSSPGYQAGYQAGVPAQPGYQSGAGYQSGVPGYPAPTYPSYTPVPTTIATQGVGMFPPASPARPPRGKGMLFLLIGLVVIVIFGSLGLYTLIHNSQVSLDNLHATATATANREQATTIFNTNATATAVANPYTPGSGKLTLSDTLDGKSNPNNWDVSSTSTSTCGFTNAAYHVTETDTKVFKNCNVGSTSYTNFAFEVQMTIVKGGAGGIIFCDDDVKNNYYLFIAGADGVYELYRYDNNVSTTLTHGTSSAIKQGEGQTNTIAVVLQSGRITLYVNQQQIGNTQDTTYASGPVGLVGYPYDVPADVAYSNVRLWTF